MPDYDAIVDEYVKVTGVVMKLNTSPPGRDWTLVREKTSGGSVDMILYPAEDEDPSVPRWLPMKWRRQQQDIKVDNDYTAEYNLLLALPHGSQILDLIANTAREW